MDQQKRRKLEQLLRPGGCAVAHYNGEFGVVRMEPRGVVRVVYRSRSRTACEWWMSKNAAKSNSTGETTMEAQSSKQAPGTPAVEGQAAKALSDRVLEVIRSAEKAEFARESVTGALLALAREAPSPEAFLGALKDADKQYREQAAQLPQPYKNAKSTIKYALQHGLDISNGRTYYAVRLEVSAHRSKARIERRDPMRERFEEAIARVAASKDPMLISSATHVLGELIAEFGGWLTRTKQLASAAVPSGAKH